MKKEFNVEEMSSISTLEFAWENKSLWSDGWDETTFCWKVAKRINSSCSSGAREEKKCEWDSGTINAAAYKGNLEMIKYCVANECPIDEWACGDAAYTVISRCLKYLRRSQKRLGVLGLPHGRLEKVIFTYSNILLSVSMINITKVRVRCSRERPLGLFEVLVRNMAAVGLSEHV